MQFPGDKPKPPNNTRDNLQHQRVSSNANGEANGKTTDDEMIDLNSNPQRLHEPSSNNHVLLVSLHYISLYV